MTDEIDTAKPTANLNSGFQSDTGTTGQSGQNEGSTGGSGGAASSFFAKAKDEAGSVREKATDAARGYAETGRDQTADLLNHVAQLVQNAAGTIEGQVGGRYAEYVRGAADNLTSASDALRSKDIDELVEDARGYIKASPALAIGAAAAAGFLLARVIKAGQSDQEA